MRKYCLLAGVLVLCISPLMAQLQMSAFLHDQYGFHMSNPAIHQEDKWVIGNPDLDLATYHSGPTLNSMIEEDEMGHYIDLGKWVDALDPRNQLDFKIDLTTLDLSFRFAQHRFALYHRFRSDNHFNYSRELAQLAARGNAEFIGERIQIGPEIETLNFQEIGLGYAYKYNSLQIGAAIKYLTGLEHVKSLKNQIELFTNPEYYQLEFLTDYEIQSAGIIDYNSLDDISIDYNSGNYFDFNGLNPGWSLDLGIMYVTESWSLGAALVDLGSIEWKDQAKTYHSKGQYIYEGIDIDQLANFDSLDLGGLIDTLETELEFKERETEYSTKLAHKLHIHGNYQLIPQLKLGGIIAWSPDAPEDEFQYGIGLLYSPWSWLEAGVSYSRQWGGNSNLGLSGAVDLGPVYLYLASDNILGLSREDDVMGHFRIGGYIHW